MRATRGTSPGKWSASRSSKLRRRRGEPRCRHRGRPTCTSNYARKNKTTYYVTGKVETHGVSGINRRIARLPAVPRRHSRSFDSWLERFRPRTSPGPVESLARSPPGIVTIRADLCGLPATLGRTTKRRAEINPVLKTGWFRWAGEGRGGGSHCAGAYFFTQQQQQAALLVRL